MDVFEDEIRCALNVRAQTRFEMTASIPKLNGLLDDYDIKREIGRGGMGIVYEAEQLSLGRRVALKILPALVGAVYPESVRRFRREAKLAARLQHTNIIPVHDFGEVEGTSYYAMELVNGRSLRDVLKSINETGGIDIVLGRDGESARPGDATGGVTRLGASAQADRVYFRRVASWIADVAEAVHYAHERGVIHRDIKPSNLLLADDGRMMLFDFGLARPAEGEALTADQNMLGTCRYMSPEQIRGGSGATEPRSDVYSLGATMYELLAFRPMFGGADQREIARQIVEREPPAPRQFVRKVPVELETICLKAIEKSADERYQSALDLANDLRRWLLDLAPLARRPSVAARCRRFVRKRRLTVALGALCVVTVGAAGAIYAGYIQQKRQAARVQLEARDSAVRLALFEANEDYHAARFEGGLRRVAAILADRPELIEADILYGKLLVALNRGDEAIAHYEAMLEHDPECWPAHYALALAYRKTDKNRSIHHGKMVEELIPDTAPAYYVKALCETDALRAIEHLRTGLELDPSRIELVMSLSDRYRQLEKYDKMLVQAERAVSLQPHWARTHGQKGLALFYNKHYSDARHAFNKAIELDPDRAVWWHNRAVTYHEMESYFEAIQDSEIAIKLEPDDALHYVVRGRARAEFGDLDGAKRDLNHAMKLCPNDMRAYLDRGVVWGKKGRWQEVIADSSRVIEIAPREIRGYRNRAIAYLRCGNSARAIDDLTTAIEIDPEYIDLYRIRAEAFLVESRLDDAVADLSRYLEAFPDATTPRMERALALLCKGRDDDAGRDIAWFAEAHELIGENAQIWASLLARSSGRAASSETATDEFESPWVRVVHALLIGDASEQDLRSAAASPCETFESYYYPAILAALSGQSRFAASNLRTAISQVRWSADWQDP